MALALAYLAAGCSPAEPPVPEAAGPGDYLGAGWSLMTDELLRVQTRTTGAGGREALRAYADCVAADAAVFTGNGFARHVRTTVYEEAGNWRADAVYTLSPELPAGISPIDAEAVLAACEENGIPLV